MGEAGEVRGLRGRGLSTGGHAGVVKETVDDRQRGCVVEGGEAVEVGPAAEWGSGAPSEARG